MSHQLPWTARLALVLSLLAPTASPAITASPREGTVPFALVRNKVLVPVSVNGSHALNLILDSGMGFDGVLLFNPALKDSIPFRHLSAASIPGAGSGTPSRAFVADSTTFGVGEARFDNQRVIILADTSMKGGTSDGVIGYSLLGHFAVEVDYDRLEIALHDAQSFRPTGSWTTVPLALNDRNWPFLDVSAVVDSGVPLPLRAYVDCASGETIEFLMRPGMKFKVPPGAEEVLLGRGLSGNIRGRRAAISRLLIGGHELHNVVAAFVPAEMRSKAGAADAVLSNGALCRFNVIFDYAHSSLHIRPNRHLSEISN
jgi:hypothetical protein